jgi:hypothetical protein
LIPDELAAPGLVFQVDVAPRRVDELTSVDGLDFAEAWAERQVVTIEDISLPVLGRAHLIRNKCAVGRPKDLLDIALLEECAN